MSRIYNQEDLQSLPVHNHDISWEPHDFKGNGTGILLEGKLKGKSRHHIKTIKGVKHKYYVLYVEVTQACKRKYDSCGKEMNPNFNETAKVSKGYLNTYKNVAKGDSDVLSKDLVTDMLFKKELSDITSNHYLNGTVSLWASEDLLAKLDLHNGDDIRIKTKSDLPFIEQVARIETLNKTVSNMAGDEPVGSSWTDKVLSNTGRNASQFAAANVEGVDDDEWDD